MDINAKIPTTIATLKAIYDQTMELAVQLDQLILTVEREEAQKPQPTVYNVRGPYKKGVVVNPEIAATIVARYNRWPRPTQAYLADEYDIPLTLVQRIIRDGRKS